MVEALAQSKPEGQTLVELAHDARNMVTALALYCELLDEPGVLNPPFRHYGRELRLVAEGSRRLLERMLLLDAEQSEAQDGKKSVVLDAVVETKGSSATLVDLPDMPIADLREEVLANRNILSALAGPSVAVSITACGGGVAVRLTGEELTRILVNLVRNAAESISGMGAIRITLGERHDGKGRPMSAVLSVEDSGCGIPEEHLEKVFESVYTTRTAPQGEMGWGSRHRGMGLSIARGIVTGAGGRIRAENRPQGGARFEIELPVGGR